MPIAVPDPLKTLLKNKAYGHVVTLNAKGQPRLTMVWMDVDGNEVLFNTAEGRRKLEDLRRDPHVTVSVQDGNNPQVYAVFYGQARTITEEGARAHIDKLANRFLGVDKYPGPPTETRQLVRISVDRISGVGPGYKPWV